jgi:hypothetical protein
MKRVLGIWLWVIIALVACAAPATEPPANPDASVEVNGVEVAAPEQENVVEEAAVADETTAINEEAASTEAAEQSGEEVVVAPEPALGSSVLLSIFEGRHLLRPADPLTGQDLSGYAPIDLGIEMAWPAFSPDGKMMATISNGSQLHLTDLTQWQNTTTDLRFPNTIASTFSPDGTRLAVAYGNRHSGTSVALVDVSERRIVAEAFVELWSRWRELHFTPDGNSIVLYGQSSSGSGNIGEDAGPARVVLLSSVDLAMEWDMVLADVVDGVRCEAASCDDEEDQRIHWQPAVVLAPDSHTLYIVHANEDKLTTVSLDRRSVETRPVQPALSWLDRFMALTAGVVQAKEFDQVSKQGVISPDGSRLYIVGWRVDVTMDDQNRPEMVEAPLGLQVIATDSGMEVVSAESGGWWLAQSPDGKQLYVHGGQGDDVWTDVLDATSLEVIARIDGFRVAPGQRLDGQPILLASNYSGQNNTSLAVVDGESLQVGQTRMIRNYAEWVTP